MTIQCLARRVAAKDRVAVLRAERAAAVAAALEVERLAALALAAKRNDAATAIQVPL